MAAKFVAESGDSSKAAIASVETAALYGLEVLVPSINTDVYKRQSLISSVS